MDFDLIVIGSGPAGYRCAITAAHLGAKVALIEKGLPGGTCLNQGCIPKATLLRLASLIEDVNALQGRGLKGRVEGDFTAAMAHKDEVVAGMRDNFSVWLKRLGVRVIAGEATFGAGRCVAVAPADSTAAPQVLSAEKIVIATGAEPKPLTECPTDGAFILNSRDFIFKLRTLPASVLFVGGGAIGAEFGFMLRQFGSKVAIVEREERLLPMARISERASGFLERKFQRLGIEVRKKTTVAEAHVAGDGVDVRFSDGGERRFEKVVVAVGRRPFTTGLGLEQAGIETDAEGFIKTSPYLETTAPGIYAIGDVRHGPMTANAALYDAKLAAVNAIKGNQFSPNYFKVPLVIHSAYEIATVGLTEEQAEEAGMEPEVARSSLGASVKARAYHDYEGFIEVVHDGETGQLLGGCVVGPEAGEQIQLLTAACQSERGLWFFKDMSYSHPSWCEELEAAIDPFTYVFDQSDREIFRAGIYAVHR